MSFTTVDLRPPALTPTISMAPPSPLGPDLRGPAVERFANGTFVIASRRSVPHSLSFLNRSESPVSCFGLRAVTFGVSGAALLTSSPLRREVPESARNPDTLNTPGRSSAGRAPPLHGGGQGFEPPSAPPTQRPLRRLTPSAERVDPATSRSDQCPPRSPQRRGTRRASSNSRADHWPPPAGSRTDRPRERCARCSLPG